MRTKLRALSAALLTLALTAPPAVAHDNGEGLVGETDDRIITFFSLGVVLFFTLVVVLGSWLQGLLEKRKEARKAAELQQRIGW